MKTKLVTAVSTEPLTIANVKEHLKLDSVDFDENITTSQSIVPANHSVSTVTGTGIDVLNKVAMVQINAGDCSAGTVDVKIQESDDDSTYTDWHSFTQIDSSNDNAIFEKLYTGSCQYIRSVATVATGTCEFSCDVVVKTYETAEDTSLSRWISAAREFGEDYTKHAFAPQTWDMYLQDWPDNDYIEWFITPLVSLTSVTIKDSDGDETVLTEDTHYIVDTDTFPGGIYLPYGETWYDFVAHPYNAIKIRGVCGYTGTAPYILPYQFKQAMLLHIGYMYEMRDCEIPKKYMDSVYNLYGPRRKEWF